MMRNLGYITNSFFLLDQLVVHNPTFYKDIKGIYKKILRVGATRDVFVDRVCFRYVDLINFVSLANKAGKFS
jgi:hypothetical protein